MALTKLTFSKLAIYFKKNKSYSMLLVWNFVYIWRRLCNVQIHISFFSVVNYGFDCSTFKAIAACLVA